MANGASAAGAGAHRTSGPDPSGGAAGGDTNACSKCAVPVDCGRAPGPARRARRARAQPQEHRRRDPARPARRDHRPLRLAARAASPSTRSTPRASGATSRASPPTPASSSARWRSPTSTTSTASRRRSRSTRRAPAATRARPSARSPRSTTTCGCSSRAIGIPHCPNAATPSSARPSSRSSTRSCALPAGKRLLVLAPLIKDRKTEGDRHASRTPGGRASSASASTATCSTSRTSPLDKYKRHTIEVVVDRRRASRRRPRGRGAGGRPTARPGDRQPIPDPDAGRLADSVETALRLGEGVMLIAPSPRDGEAPDFEEQRYSEQYCCPYDGITVDELEPRNFSLQLARTAPARPAPASASAWRSTRTSSSPTARRAWPRRRARAVGAHADATRRGGSRSSRPSRTTHGFGLHGARSTSCRPRRSTYVLYGGQGREGGRPLPPRARREHATTRRSRASSRTSSGATGRPTRSTSRPSSRSSWSAVPCPTCGGARLKPESLAVTVDDRNISDVTTHVGHATRSAGRPGSPAPLTEREQTIAHQVAQGDPRAARLPRRRRARLPDARPHAASTLSGGEAQRIRLATQIGSA